MIKKITLLQKYCNLTNNIGQEVSCQAVNEGNNKNIIQSETK